MSPLIPVIAQRALACDPGHGPHGSVCSRGLGYDTRRAHNGDMRRLIGPILIVLALAGCSSSGSGGPPFGANAHFAANDPTVIQVNVRDPLPVAHVFLVDPTGMAT